MLAVFHHDALIFYFYTTLTASFMWIHYEIDRGAVSTVTVTEVNGLCS